MSDPQIKVNESFTEALETAAKKMMQEGSNFTEVALSWPGGKIFLVRGDTKEFKERNAEKGALLPLITITVEGTTFYPARR